MAKPSGFVDMGLETLPGPGSSAGCPTSGLRSGRRGGFEVSRAAIRRVMFLAPLLMVVAFGAACLSHGRGRYEDGNLDPHLGLRASIIIPLDTPTWD